ncbi:MAG: hypothetical protein IJJ33_01930 [Victivallales bacterium]|nr:hypothetical protein [Victivallales bacterium]
MENLPVLLLTDLICADERVTAEDVKRTHEVHDCPVCIRLPMESRVALRCGDNHENYSEFRYTPRAYFAVKVWEATRERLLSLPDFANALDIEWCPVAASFNSIRFVNGYPDEFIRHMFVEMERLANSGTVEIQYGRFDEPAISSRPDYPRRFYIMPQEMLASWYNYGTKDELDSKQGQVAERMSWEDIKDAFVVLKPIQLAYIAGDPMNRHTPLDEEFINACSRFDYEKVKELVEKGANIHAVGKYGSTAMSDMVEEYYDWCAEKREDDTYHCPIIDDRNYDRFVKVADYLLARGYNPNLGGYGDATPLYLTKYHARLKAAQYLLDHGADPNIPSYIGDGGNPFGEAVLYGVWEEQYEYPEYPELDDQYKELIKLLLFRGALPIPLGKKWGNEELSDWIEEQKMKEVRNVNHCGKMTELDLALVHCAGHLWLYDIALVAQSGGNINLWDDMGRNLLQIALDEAQPDPKISAEYFQNHLMEMSLMLLCGLKLRLSDKEMEQAKQTCRRKGYARALEAIESVENANGHL